MNFRTSLKTLSSLRAIAKQSAFLIIIAFFINNYLTFSQEADSKNQFSKDAESYFKNENFLAALPLYLKLDSLEPKIDYKFKIGICYMYKTDEKKKSVEYLEQVLKAESKTPDLYFYLGKAYHVNYQFDEAIENFNEAKKQKTSKENLNLTDRFLENVENGKKLVENPVVVRIENIGPPVNTEHSEYVPVISADESILIFTYTGEKSTGGLQNKFGEPDQKGRYFEDILYSVKLGGESWSNPEKLGDNINIRGHDACLGLAANGQKLFIYKDTEGTSGDIYVSDLDGYLWSDPVRLGPGINSEYWEGNVSLSANEGTLYFSSERPGGYGGRDIYKSIKNEDGEWDKAVNLGNVINTPYDDESPFIHADDKMLYFSSKGHNSMGGFDIFVSRIQDDGSWSTPENIGYPINTTDDDKYYVVSANGERGYYSSAKSGGYGQQDIYIVHPDPFSKEHILLLVKGIITANDQPVEAKINVTVGKKNTSFPGNYKSNSETGKYIAILSTGDTYTLTYNVPGFTPHVENVDATNIRSYKEIIKDVKLYSDDYVPQITIEGNVFYLDRPDEPVVGITVYLTSSDGAVSRQTVTGNNGYFIFKDLPDGKDYTLFVNEIAMIKGNAKSPKGPKEGLSVNNVFTAKDGSFKVKIAGFPLQYLTDFDWNKSSAVSDPELYKNILRKYGNSSAQDLLFKVQIGAYSFPDNFNFKFFNPLGNVSTQLFKDGITRFTMGKYKTLNEAENVKQQARKIGDKDAFITIFYKGERKLLSKDIAKEF